MTVVCPSVCSVPDPKSRMEGRRKLKIDKKKAHDTGSTVTSFRGQQAKGQGNKVTSQNSFRASVLQRGPQMVAPSGE